MKIRNFHDILFWGGVLMITAFLLMLSKQVEAADVKQCIQSDNSYPYVITQCSDGTVTVADKSKETVSVCSKNPNGQTYCTKVE